MSEPAALRERIERVQDRVAAAARRSGRAPEAVTLIAVSKGHRAETIADAATLGLRHFGENRVQEARQKIPAVAKAHPEILWHLVGHLQRNKARQALELFDLVHSIDSGSLAERIDRLAWEPVDVLVEVNVAGEASKHGATPEALPELLEAVRGLANVCVRGLMTVAPQAADPEEVRPVFRRLRALAEEHGLEELSMGMTDDFEVAIEEGATMVRVGRALFGPRAE